MTEQWLKDPAAVERLAEAYRGALAAEGYRMSELPASSSGAGRPRTSTPAAFERFASLRGAPDVLAVLELFASRAGLREAEDFAVSCLPGNNRTPKSRCRATAVSVGGVEVLVVEMDRAHGGLARVSVWAEPDEDIAWLAARDGVIAEDSTIGGGGIGLVLPGASAVQLLLEDRLAQITARRVSAIRRPRHPAWHNPWLWALVDSGVASPPRAAAADGSEARRAASGVASSPPGSTGGGTGAPLVGSGAPSSPIDPLDEDWDVSRDDAVVYVRQRRGQAEFRRRLLASGPQQCAICGLGLVDVLEAAHLIPHARGGKASKDNGRLLCANHHRAFDARLYRWTGTAFEWVGGGEEPNFGGARPKDSA